MRNGMYSMRKARLSAIIFVATLAGTTTLIASPAWADSSVGSWSDLVTAFNSAPHAQDTTITLTADITAAADGHLVVPNNSNNNGARITLDLAGHQLNIPANSSNLAGIDVSKGAKLTIEDTASGGSLTVTGGDYAAGIGLSYAAEDPLPNGQVGGGEIVIKSGTVTTTGGVIGSGIGGAYYYGGGSVTIDGGVVNATGGLSASGIGNGYYQINGDVMSITINGGTVTAVGGDAVDYGVSFDGGAAGIGSGTGPDSGDFMPTMTFACANITATGGTGTGLIGGGAGVGSAAEDSSGDGPWDSILTIDGVEPSGAPAVAGSGVDGSDSLGGFGSKIAYTPTSANSPTVAVSTVSAAAGSAGNFTMTCVSPSLPDTGPTWLNLWPVGLSAIALGAVVVYVRRRIALN